jgi:hypothetical protein
VKPVTVKPVTETTPAQVVQKPVKRVQPGTAAAQPVAAAAK